jgi:hypothetical protein
MYTFSSKLKLHSSGFGSLGIGYGFFNCIDIQLKKLLAAESMVGMGS